MVRWTAVALIAPIALAAVAACGRSEGVPDEALGGLVIEPKPLPKVDVERAAKDPDELSRALAAKHGAVLGAVGPHVATIKTTTIVEESGKVVEQLSDEAMLELGELGAFHGVYTNSADYGREVIYLVKPKPTLYLRPRYQRWHVRAPETDEEAAQIRDDYFAAIAATWELVAPATELTDKGPIEVAGRAARKIEIKQAPSPRENPRETLTQRRWREGRTIDNVSGEVLLDADKAVPLAVKLSGTIGFVRDGRKFSMKVRLDASLSNVGKAAQLAAPPENETVATPGRLGEVDERDYLLHGIAPPIRKHADGTAVAPSVPPTGSGSAAKPKPDGKQDDKPGAKSDTKSDNKPGKPDDENAEGAK